VQILLCSLIKKFFFFSPNTRAQTRSQVVQVDSLHLQIWLHPLGKCKISDTNMLINRELREDIITKPINEKAHLRLAESASSE
jgi:hypothetical protein